MKKKRWITLVLWTLLFASCNSEQHDLVISNVNIINVDSGDILKNRYVAIDGDRISIIYDNSPSFSDSTKIIDGTGKYLIPGLWDMHVHHYWNYKDSNPLLIANGIVGVREMDGDIFTHRELKKAIENGDKTMPDIYSGSPIIDGKPPVRPGNIEVADVEEATYIANQQIDFGYDFLKVYSFLSKESFDAIAEVANQRNTPFAGHVPESITVQHAAKMGMASAEHFYSIPFGSSTKQDSLYNAGVLPYKVIDLIIDSFSREKFDSLCQILKENQLWISPTMIHRKGMTYRYDEEFVNDDRLKFLPNYMIYDWIGDSERLNDPKAKAKTEREIREYEFIRKLLGPLVENGVGVIAGSDYPNPFSYPGFSLHDELNLYVEGGMDPLSALRTATINPAIFMKKESEYGTVEVGKLASLVLLNSNPLEDINNIRAVNAVILRGKSFEEEELSEMLEWSKANAKKVQYTEWLPSYIEKQGVKSAMDSLISLEASGDSPYRLLEWDINGLGYYYLTDNDIETALKVFETNITFFPTSPNVYDSYGEALLRSNQLEKSLLNYQKALIINPYSKSAEVMVDSLKNLIKIKKANKH